MSKFAAGSEVRLYTGPAFHRVKPDVGPLKHGETYKVAEAKDGGRTLRIELEDGKKTQWIDSDWFENADKPASADWNQFSALVGSNRTINI